MMGSDSEVAAVTDHRWHWETLCPRN